ncbi:MAG: ATP-binding protein, partial [Gammaproteobacteria bacterium]|nr:ATP-binding protein [Gammaproteobacteria bacterium]
EFPVNFQLITAMNPCPCGYYGHPNGRCRCSPERVERYRNKISGPLLDRIDMHIEVPSVPLHVLRQHQVEETSARVSQRVQIARSRQLARSAQINSQLNNQQIEQICQLNKTSEKLIEQAMDRLGLSARAYHRILKIARTIADLDAMDNIDLKHLSEAISYRQLDRQLR